MMPQLVLPQPAHSLTPQKRTYLFCPYVDVLLWPTPDLSDVLACTRADRLTLAFVTANGQLPSWGGVQPADWPELVTMVKQIGPYRCVCAFGGANGIELAQAIMDVPRLVNAYRKIIDTFHFDTIEFDIEGAATEDTVSVARRNSAIQQLNQLYPTMKINYCLPVMPTGLVNSGVAILKDAKTKGCRINSVNVMAMDYGQNNIHMGDAAISAAKATQGQIDTIGLGSGVGVIPMIGQNDTGECFTLADAKHVAEWARATPGVSCVSMWSCARDSGKKGALYMSSNIEQKPYEFCQLLRGG